MSDTQAQVAMRPRRLGHANLFVSNLTQSLDFYNKVLGLEIVRLEPEIEAGFLSAGTTHHDVGLMQAANKPRIGIDGHVQIPSGRGTHAGLNHFGWEMETEAELVAAYHRAKAANVEVNRTTNHQISHSVYMFDPDGNLNEFYADAIDNWRSIFNLDQESLVSGHWDPDPAPPSTKPRYVVNPEIRRVDDAVFHPIRVTHAIMVARDFGKMQDFYQQVAGLELIDEIPGPSITLRAKHGAFDLGLVAERGGLKLGLHLIAFRLSSSDDLDSCDAQLSKLKIPVNKKLSLPQRRSIIVQDPDNIAIELYWLDPKSKSPAFDVDQYLS